MSYPPAPGGDGDQELILAVSLPAADGNLPSGSLESLFYGGCYNNVYLLHIPLVGLGDDGPQTIMIL
jgi:hypothetical protein